MRGSPQSLAAILEDTQQCTTSQRKAREMPRCPGAPSVHGLDASQVVHPAAHQIFPPFDSQHALARRRVTAVATAKQRRGRKGDGEAGSLPRLPCRELMKQGKLGYTSSINFHTHTCTQTHTTSRGIMTRARTDSRHIEHVFQFYLNIFPPPAQTKTP